MTFELWDETIGPKPKVRVYERADRGLAVYLRWHVGGKKHERRTEVGFVRDRRGRLRPSLQREALREADALREELLGRGKARARRRALTLEDGVRMAFGDRGAYPLDPARDEYTRQTKRLALLGVDLLGGPSLLWEEVTPGMIRAIWRRIARETGGQGGHRKAVGIVGTVFRISGWLASEDPDGRYPRPWRGWQKELREHWRKVGGDATPQRPRYTDQELAALWRHRDQADPRLRLALVLGLELRGGQLVRARRSGLERDEAGWTLAVPFGSERKRAPVLRLSATEAAAIEAELATGYLAELEAARQRDALGDYALFPAGKLRDGRVPIARAEKPLTRGSPARMLRDLEKIAGVEHVSGRAWHGLRRLMTDLYETATADARLKDMAGGWAPGSEMRRGIYQEGESDALREQVAQLRDAVRETLEAES